MGTIHMASPHSMPQYPLKNLASLFRGMCRAAQVSDANGARAETSGQHPCIYGDYLQICKAVDCGRFAEAASVFYVFHFPETPAAAVS